jgi:hypothetical protein
MVAMLIDEALPHFDFVERHGVDIAADNASVWRALHEADLAGPLSVRLLMGLRALPAAIASRHLPRRRKVTLRTLQQAGFKQLAENAPHETLLGIVGEFWRLRGNVSDFEAANFSMLIDGRRARAAWNFVVETTGNKSRLTTETRVACPDARSRRRFRLYWTIVRPFSGWIRIAMLREIRRTALRGIA